MKRLALTEPGLHLTLLTGNIKPPAPHEIQVKVTAVGLNPVDAKLAVNGHPEWQYPHTPGLDAVGEITALGSKAGNYHLEQRVLWHGDLRTDGVLAQKVNVPVDVVTPLTEEIDDLRAAALPCAGMTAWQAIERMQLRPQQTVLIQAGAGGVGFYAIQLAKRKGARVITTASREHHSYLGAIGADRCIDYTTEDVVQRIKDVEPYLDAVLDSVGGDASASTMNLLRRGGHFVSLLGLPKVDEHNLFSIAPSIHIIGLGGAYSAESGSIGELASIADKLVTLLAEGELQSPAIERIPFTADAVSAALERELSGKMPGKQVVTLT